MTLNKIISIETIKIFSMFIKSKNDLLNWIENASIKTLERLLNMFVIINNVLKVFKNKDIKISKILSIKNNDNKNKRS